MNVRPVYERVDGHTHQSVYPSPIGTILTPQLCGAFNYNDPASTLPFTSSLCGTCYDAYPIHINIPKALVKLCHHAVGVQRGDTPTVWDVMMGVTKIPMSSGPLMKTTGKLIPLSQRITNSDRRLMSLPWPTTAWSTSQDVSTSPSKTFRQWMTEHQEEQGYTTYSYTPATHTGKEGAQL